MYDYIKGQVTFKRDDFLVLENRGIGYRIITPARTHRNIEVGEEEITFYIHHHVREDGETLYGFSSTYERDVYSAILGVNGVGAKGGLKILSEIEPTRLIDSIVRQDIETLKNIKGLGSKTAAKILLELKNRVGYLVKEGPGIEKEIGERHDDISRQTAAALRSLGYREMEIKQIMGIVMEEKYEVLEEAVKKALALLSKA